MQMLYVYNSLLSLIPPLKKFDSPHKKYDD